MSDLTLGNIVLEKTQKKSVPLYQQIRQKILEQILNNTLKSGDILPSMAFLSNKWGVTYRTIKSAYDLLEQDGAVSFRMGKCIVTDNAFERLHEKKNILSISYITCHHSDPYYALASAGIRRFALEKGLEYVMVDVGNSKRRFWDAVTCPGEDVGGLLILPFEEPGYEKAVQKAIDSGKKVVFLDRILPGVDASSVEVDHFSVAFQATNHLAQTHNRPVYYLAFVSNPSGARDWFKGWASAMKSYNYTSLDKFIFDLPVHEHQLEATIDIGLEYSIAAARQLFKSRKEDIYCIFAGNDFIARGVYIAAEEMGLEVGKNVFLVGSNDMPFAEKMEVPLSSVRTIPSTEHLGYQAAKLLYDHLNDTIRNPVRQLIPVELVVRTSSTGRNYI
jgi:DNA-binding LacI/PurR family transcriptional regulator